MDIGQVEVTVTVFGIKAEVKPIGRRMESLAEEMRRCQSEVERCHGILVQNRRAGRPKFQTCRPYKRYGGMATRTISFYNHHDVRYI
jgi:hypothetical protein